MLTFVGLGLWDERSVTVEGREAIRAADRAFAEFYTSRLAGVDLAGLEAYQGVDIEVRDREGVERNPEPILAAAEAGDAVFLTAGDTMISTTHVDLRLRAHERGVGTRVVHGPTAQSAAAGLTGLQNYRFGKATTLPFEYAHGGAGIPESVAATLDANCDRGLHTLVYLDIKVGEIPGGDAAGERDGAEGSETPGEYMTASRAAGRLAEAYEDCLGVAVCRAGSPAPLVVADRLSELATQDFGDPLHLLVLPGDLHPMEADALAALAGAPADLLPDD
jgi:diphthine synthase